MRRSPGFASKDGTGHPIAPAAFPEFSSGLRQMSSLTVARQRGIFTRFPVFAERRKRAFRKSEKSRDTALRI